MKQYECVQVGHHKNIKKTIQETCGIVDNVTPHRPELSLYASDMKMGKLLWNVSFTYYTQPYDSEYYDSITIDIQVDASTREACYSNAWHGRRHKALPIKLEPCNLDLIAKHSDLGGILGVLSPPTLPVLKPFVPPDYLGE